MAKPDCDDGFMMLAHELFAALATAGFTKWEWVVIREVLSQVYGPKRTRTARVSPSEVAGRVGTFKESIMRAVRGLVGCGVLVKVAECEYRFVKDYESWDGRHSVVERGYCAATRTANPSKSAVNNGAHASTQAVNNGAHVVNNGAHATGAQALTIVNSGAHETVPPQTPLDGKGIREKGGDAPAPASAPARDPEWDRVAELAAEIGADVSWSLWAINRFKMGDKPAVIEAALSEAVNCGKVNQQYVARIAARFAKEGIPGPPSHGGNGKHKPDKPAPATNGADYYHIARPIRDDPKIPAAEALRILKGHAS